MAEVIIDGCKIVVEGEVKAGTPVLFAVHGSGGGAWLWRMLRDALGDEASLLAIDLPGHGASEGKGASKVADYREVVRMVAREMNLDRPIAMGHSMGGAVAMDWALNNPEELKGIVFVCSGARLRVLEVIFKSIKENYEGYVIGQVKMAFGSPPSDEIIELLRSQSKYVDPEVIYNDFVACDTFDVMDKIADMKLPVLAVCGDKDVMTPPKYTEYLSRNIPNAQHKIFPGAGHMLLLEQPREVAMEIINWLKTI